MATSPIGFGTGPGVMPVSAHLPAAGLATLPVAEKVRLFDTKAVANGAVRPSWMKDPAWVSGSASPVVHASAPSVNPPVAVSDAQVVAPALNALLPKPR